MWWYGLKTSFPPRVPPKGSKLGVSYSMLLQLLLASNRGWVNGFVGLCPKRQQMWVTLIQSLGVFDSGIQLLIEVCINSFTSFSLMRFWFYYSYDDNC